MASTGHLITLVGILFFFLMILDSHVERRISTSSTLGIPRWHKRVQYYFFKVTYFQKMQKELSVLPGLSVRNSIFYSKFNEHDRIRRPRRGL